MNFINFILWLSVGAVIGWFASLMVQVEHRRNLQPLSALNLRSEES